MSRPQSSCEASPQRVHRRLDSSAAHRRCFALLLAVLGLWAWHAAFRPSPPALLIVFGAALVALIGWIDDRRGLPVRTRLTVHVIAATLVGSVAASRPGAALAGAALFVWWTFWT